MVDKKRRQRRLARERYERQQSRRLAKRRRRRTVGIVVSVALAVPLALVAGWVVISALTDSGSPSPSASPSARSTPTVQASPVAANCLASSVTPVTTAKTFAKPTQVLKKGTPYFATVSTNCGPIDVRLAVKPAPTLTNSFAFLADRGFYDNTTCHRLTTSGIYVLQCGDPTGTGSGGPGYELKDENLPKAGKGNYPAGTVAMANSGANTNGSQFFIVYKDTTLPPNYAIIGTVSSGLPAVRNIAAAGVTGGGTDGEPKQQVVMYGVKIQSG